MVEGYQVLTMLRPQGGWAIVDSDYDSIQWLECEPLTKKEFEDGFLEYENWKLQKEQEKEEKKNQAMQKLLSLGLTVEDIKLILGD